jgi:hypothetical protein
VPPSFEVIAAYGELAFAKMEYVVLPGKNALKMCGRPALSTDKSDSNAMDTFVVVPVAAVSGVSVFRLTKYGFASAVHVAPPSVVLYKTGYNARRGWETDGVRPVVIISVCTSSQPVFPSGEKAML